MLRPRALCFLAAAVLWALGILGVAALGAAVKVNVALMLIVFGTDCFVLGLVLGAGPRQPAERR